jgi:hypothetical protein
MRQTPTPTRDAKGRFLPRTATGATPSASDASDAPTVATALYTHTAHPHTPRNVNEQHKAEIASKHWLRQLNDRIAVRATYILGSMYCFYVFVLLAFTGFPGIPWVTCTPQAFLAWLSSQTLQLIALPLLGAGQLVLSRHSELQNDEMFATSQHSFADIEQIAAHLTAQDAKILEIERINQRQLALLISLQSATPPKE